MTPGPQTYDPTPAALRILARSYRQKWVFAGDPFERGHMETTMPPPDQLAEAVAAGVMFTEIRDLDHDGWIRAARLAATQITAGEVGKAFLASLSSRRMDLRSALASYALLRFLPEHAFVLHQNWGCAVCGIGGRDGTVEPEDLNAFSQDRFGFAGTPGDIRYATFDLEQFRRAPRLQPSDADVAIGQEMIDFLRQLPPKTTAAQASPNLKMVPGTRSERNVLIDILGVSGVLNSPGHPGYDGAFIPYTMSITWPGQRYAFGHYPTWWWKAAGGISDSALSQFLPKLH